jgi:hypothetical protein
MDQDSVKPAAKVGGPVNPFAKKRKVDENDNGNNMPRNA